MFWGLPLVVLGEPYSVEDGTQVLHTNHVLQPFELSPTPEEVVLVCGPHPLGLQPCSSVFTSVLA